MLDQVLNALTILAWVLFVLYLLFSTLRGFQAGGVSGAIGSVTRWRVLIALLLVIGISLLSASLVFVQPQEVAVVVSLVSRDGYREDPLRSGLHWIAPLAEKTVIYPIYWQTYTMSSEALEGEKIGDDSIAARTSDGQAVYVDVSVIYRIDSNDVIRIHIDLQDRYVQDYIRPVLRGIVRTEVSQFTADEVNSSKRKNLEAILDEKMREAFGEKGFVLDRFLLRNIGFSTAYASAIEQKQVAEQEKQQKEFQAEQIRKLAEGQRYDTNDAEVDRVDTSRRCEWKQHCAKYDNCRNCVDEHTDNEKRKRNNKTGRYWACSPCRHHVNNCLRDLEVR